jgi:aspartyl-tRNA(Asn)/glutamyl-tRNA(Gln) amidotransferase subunit A
MKGKMMNNKSRENLIMESLSNIRKAILSKEITVKEVVQLTLNQIDKHAERLNAFISISYDQSIKRANFLDKELQNGNAHGNLYGIPFAVKDCIDISGTFNTCGTEIRRKHLSRETASCVKKLESEGAIFIGKTNLHEWAFGGTSSNPFYGFVKNPWNEKYIPGGSSGGSAVAVATGMASFALGTDTGGSVRIPSSYSGVAGLQPTVGTIATDGAHPLSWTFDSIGPMARTAECIKKIFVSLIGKADYESFEKSLSKLRGKKVGVIPDYFSKSNCIDPLIFKIFENITKEMEKKGVEFHEYKIDALNDIFESFTTIVLAEAASVHSGKKYGERKHYGKDIREALAIGDLILASDYLAALRNRWLLAKEFMNVFKSVDFIITPTTPNAAELIGTEIVIWPDGNAEPLLSACCRNCIPVNYAGLCSISQPCATLDDGLPIGIQTIALPGKELDLINFACELEREFCWYFSPKGY